MIPSPVDEDLPAELCDDLGLLLGEHPADADGPPAQDGSITAINNDIQSIGLRLGSLAARIYTDPHLPFVAFTSFVSWIDQHMPRSLGTTNHSPDFPREFGRVMSVHLQLCLSLQHWQRLPALRIPSDYFRIIDGYTCLGEGLFVLVHVLTGPDGEIFYMIVDLSPNASNVIRTGREGEGQLHKWKTGKAVAEHIFTLERGMAISQWDSTFRSAGTNGDGAYIGPYSNDLMKHYQDKLVADFGPRLSPPLANALRTGSLAWEFACEFHALQISGRETDALFEEGLQFDDLLRWLALRFNYGHARIVARGVAKHFGIEWRKVLAPRSDGFKVTGYSRRCAERFVYLYRVIHGALCVELEAVYKCARHVAEKQYHQSLEAWQKLPGSETDKRQPRAPSASVGFMLKESRTIRAMGRQLLSPHQLVFGLGRYELRDRYLAAYSVLTQNFKISALVKVRSQGDMLASMHAAVYGIASLAGAIRMLRRACWGRNRVERWKLGRKALWLHVKVLAAHAAWRFIPGVVRALPDMLLEGAKDGGSFRGVSLISAAGSSRFEEPAIPVPSLVARWCEVEDGLARLARWARVEAAKFRQYVLLWDTVGNAKLVQPEFKVDPDAGTGEVPSAIDENNIKAELHSMGDEDVGLAHTDAWSPELVASSPVLLCLARDRSTSLTSSLAAPAHASDEPNPEDAVVGADTDVEAGTLCLWQVRRPPTVARVLASSFPLSRRRRLWECASECFHPTVLAQPMGGDVPPGLRDSLLFVFDFLKPIIFSVRPADVTTYSDPPPEMFEDINFQDMLQQYQVLRKDFIPRLLKDPRAIECFRVRHAIVVLPGGKRLRVGLQHLRITDPIKADGGFVDMSLQLGMASCIGREATIIGDHPIKGATVVIKSFIKIAVEAKIYQRLMVWSYVDVRAAKVWHVLRLYHRLIMGGGTTEALAETVCSFCSVQVRGLHGRRPALGDILAAVKLRSAGVTGTGKDTGFIHRCLDLYFRGGRWHVDVSARALQDRKSKHPLSMGPSPAVVHYRHDQEIGVQFPWLMDTWQRCLVRNMARRNLTVLSAPSSRDDLVRNPKGGAIIKVMRKSSELHDALRQLAKSAAPDELDPRVWAWLDE